jgi:DNA-binding LacI/PurR family transcriptional regulator
MKPVRRQPLSEQTATHLIDAMRAGRWGGVLPGVNSLAKEFDVSRETVRAALRSLESNGSLVPGGPGRSRVIAVEQPVPSGPRSMRVAVLLHSPLVEENAAMQHSLFRLQHAIQAAGHNCFFSEDCQERLRHDVRRIARFAIETTADAWVVVGGTSETLQWFASQPTPAIAFGGRSSGLPIASAGTDLAPALTEAIHELTALGHRRIVLISPHYWRKPVPGRLAKVFTSELTTRGILPDAFNLPDWDETPEGLQSLLHSLFHVTPPTALLVLEPAHAVAIFAFLGQRGMQVGRDVSLLCMSSDPAFAWRRPAMAQFHSNSDPLIRRVVRWLEGVARGCPDRNQKLFPVEFIRGGTMRPVKR